jgi:type II secretory pathway pseudopilin PulG
MRRQRGAAFIVMLVILIIGVTALLVSSLSSTAIKSKRDEVTAKALAQAKEALIGYAISSEKANNLTARPGNFPCPDTDAPGTSGYGNENVIPMCAAGDIGRLPWKTLGIPELLDADGEPLWYAISGNFRKSPAPGIINSDTPGTLLVYAHDGITLLTPPSSEAVAIVFAPGSIVGSQLRSSATDKTTASNYLDIANGFNNSIAGGPFIAADKSNTFNDRLMIVSTRDFMPIIEKRVAKELKTILENYLAANGVYPYPTPFASCDNTSNTLTCDSDITICRGRLPLNAAPTNWGGSYALPVTTGGSPWFIANKWYRVIYYSVNDNNLAPPKPGCVPPLLNVSGVNADALFFMPGTPQGVVVRTYPNNNVSWYLEDLENRNMDDTYVIPTSISNDQLYVLP